MCHFGVMIPCDLEHRILRQNQINFVRLYHRHLKWMSDVLHLTEMQFITHPFQVPVDCILHNI